VTFDEEMMNIRTITKVTLVAVGILYGFLSAAMNQNPFYSPTGKLLVSQDQQHRAWSWCPKALWLPSFILCKAPVNGLGITHTRSGYLFRTESNRRFYFICSSLVGGCLGALLAMAVGIRSGRSSVDPTDAAAAGRGQ